MQTLATDTTTAAAATRTLPSRGLGTLRSEDFFKILISEMQQQDPLKPNDTSDMIGDISQIRSIELSHELTDVLAKLSSQQRTAGAGELLGKYVTAKVTGAGGVVREISGVVTGVRFDADGSAVLELDTGDSVRAADVTYVTSVETADALKSADPQGADAAAAPASDAKDAQTAKSGSGGLLPWLNLSGTFQL